jgi:hypothetical protein
MTYLWHVGEQMRYSILRISLVVCLVATLSGQTPEWKKYKNADGNFSVLLPLEPSDTKNGNSDVMVSHTIQAIAGAVSYTVVYVRMTGEQTVDEANFKVYKDGVLKELPSCTVVEEQPAAPAVQGYIGHWYRMNCEISNTKLTFVGNLYWGKTYAYAVLGMFAAGPSDPPNIKKFVDSFSVIDPSR